MGGVLEGKTALITGAASGIGAATARLFAAEGAAVVLADLQADAGQKLAEELGKALFVPTNVSREADIANAVDLAVDRFGRLDVMVNNAGIVGVVGSITDISIEDWNRTIAVLMTGVFLGMKHAARVMVPRTSGCILSTASTAGILGGLGPHAYTTAKHAIIGLTKSVASELASRKIRVNAVAPGGVYTPLLATAGLSEPDEARAMLEKGSPNGVATTAEDIANAFLFLASDAAKQISGQTLAVDVGVTVTGGSSSPFHSAPSSMIGKVS